MQKLAPVFFVIILFVGLAAAIFRITPSEISSEPETWSAFIYKNGYNSGKYEKKDDFDSYPSCKAYAEQESDKLQGVAWECGLNCGFDSMRQGFHCETMTNE
ncbi:conserved hypothetical protein [Shewanella halifaxensis HAW-EB4]|uniref:Uncharacterized protein n=1 Tax=Shewanella halifaxensis (strain HAW-EB4) TaxID=458817 RepID=B0TVP8_SHEHH|nr:hypothetical protein [Shewanella halifaxensis]ABZ78351.1 conserved hypothetical protein [Shewanella halifaxensis HAW-EB4]